MYSVLLIDDEPLALEGLKQMIEWEKFGFHILDVCSNGETGIEYIERYKPDLVITDICMPGINGLDLIQYAKSNVSDNIKFIILTGYSEFPYAKRAIKYGIKYFLLKPIFREDMEKVISEVGHELDKSNETNTTINENYSTIVTEALAQTIHGSSDYEDFIIIDKLKNSTGYIKAWCYMRILLPPSVAATDPTVSQVINEKRLEALYDGQIYLVEKSYEFLGIVLGFNESEEMLIRRHIEDLKAELINILPVQYVIVGDITDDITKIVNSYLSNMQSIVYKFFTKSSDIIYCSDLRNEILIYMPYNTDYFKLIIEAIEDVDKSKLKSIIDKAFLSFKEKFLAPEIIVMFAVNVIYKAISIVNNLGGNTENLEKNYIALLKKKEYLSMEILQETLITFCLQCCTCIEKTRKTNDQDIELQIEEFVKNNYSRNIKIKEISQILHMNTAYLGQVINKKLGMSFSEYVNKIRIMEAQKLINTTEMKIYEVAEAVGYKDYKSFFQQFEKITGMKPQEYKNSSV